MDIYSQTFLFKVKHVSPFTFHFSDVWMMNSCMSSSNDWAYLHSVHFPQILFQELFPDLPLDKGKGSFRWQR